jgi:mitotic spindle assembly checkpoint protein MAD2
MYRREKLTFICNCLKQQNEIFRYGGCVWCRSILYQRGIYPPESFTRLQKYGLGLFVTSDEALRRYITSVLAQMQGLENFENFQKFKKPLVHVSSLWLEWLSKGIVRKMVMVISSIEPVEVLERWTFDIQTTNNDSSTASAQTTTTTTASQAPKSAKEITAEIAAVMRQIAASVTFLPLLETACSFDLLMYTDHGAPVPVQWEESAPRYIPNAQHVRLRSVDTSVHKVILEVFSIERSNFY